MFKLLGRLKTIDWLLILLISALVVLQVWCTMLMTDKTADIIREITFLSYHNNPSSLGEGLQNAFIAAGRDWNALYAFLASSDPHNPMIETVYSISQASLNNVWVHAGWFGLIILGQAGTSLIISFIASIVTARFATSLRSALNQKVSSFSLDEINRFSTASLVTRSTNDIENVQICVLLMLRMIFAAPITAIWAICKIQASSSALTFVTGIAIFFIVGVLSFGMVLALPKFKISQTYVDKLNAITREGISGIRVIHAYNAEGYQEERFKKANNDLTKLNLFTSKVIAILNPALGLTLDGVTIAILGVGAYVINKGEIDYAAVSAFSTLAVQIIISFMMLLMMFILWPRASVSAKRINEVLKTKPSINDPVNEKATLETGTLEFENVSFSYPNAKAPIISNISFKAKKGDTIAIIGPTGCGKSSLVNLISRLYDVSEGKIKVDGVDIRELQQKTLHSKIGFIPQKGVLFSGTVASNVKLGDPNISDEKMQKALEIASASEFVSQMEKGVDSPISQGGTNVSGGQKQRLCIARALAISPEFLVFDDSFSALDFKTDLEVRENIKKELPEVTKIIVAQRIGTIMNANEILVMEEGKVVGQGKHEELLQSCPAYLEIALSQLSKEELGL